MKTLAPLIAVLLLGAAPAAAATSFQTPSRNIGCVISKAGARCDIRERSWRPPPKPRSCPVDWGNGLTVERRGFAYWVCAGDTVLGTGKVLGYRRSITRGLFTCTSRRNGVRCVNGRTEHGFKIARRTARWF